MIEIKNFSFTYQRRDKPTLRNLNLRIKKGEFILITGTTGCGKTTLLKALNGLIPHESAGVMEGNVIVAGSDTGSSPMSELTKKVGLVFQNPDDQIFSTKVENEVAFGPENLCFKPKEIESSINHALTSAGLTDFRNRHTATLSGGEKQRLAIASVLAMHPQVLALDEPFSQIDISGTKEMLDVIRKLNRNGMTVVMVEHRIPAVFPVVSRIVIMDSGRVVLDESKERAYLRKDIFRKLGLWLPEDRDLISFSNRQQIRKFKKNKGKTDKGETVLEADDIYFKYEKKGRFVLKGVSLRIRRGEIVALLGDNGTGKSTLLLHFAAILKPERGKAKILGMDSKKLNSFILAGRVGVVFQDPNLMLFRNTVKDEVEFGPEALKFSPPKVSYLVSRVLDAFKINNLIDETPLSLSSGQRLRVAASSMASMDPEIFLLDEPTQGQDKVHIDVLMNFLKNKSNDGAAVLFITHNLEVALQYADRILFMNGGRISEDV